MCRHHRFHAASSIEHGRWMLIIPGRSRMYVQLGPQPANRTTSKASDCPQMQRLNVAWFGK